MKDYSSPGKESPRSCVFLPSLKETKNWLSQIRIVPVVKIQPTQSDQRIGKINPKIQIAWLWLIHQVIGKELQAHFPHIPSSPAISFVKKCSTAHFEVIEIKKNHNIFLFNTFLFTKKSYQPIYETYEASIACVLWFQDFISPPLLYTMEYVLVPEKSSLVERKFLRVAKVFVHWVK